MKLTIEGTADGSPTLYREDIDEHYHSVKGALAESRHVYIDCGWKARCHSEPEADRITVFEVGFGTGLNAALTAEEAIGNGVVTRYYSAELYPLSADTIGTIAAAYPDELREALIAVNEAAWDEAVEINSRFVLHKLQVDLLTMEIPEGIDVVYFDAFAPEKQPEMWGEEIFAKIFASMNPGGVLVTYCAKGAIRRQLEGLGFHCERLSGPPGGKREILRARVPS